jgi:hypothetical protein
MPFKRTSLFTATNKFLQKKFVASAKDVMAKWQKKKVTLPLGLFYKTLSGINIFS